MEKHKASLCSKKKSLQLGLGLFLLQHGLRDKASLYLAGCCLWPENAVSPCLRRKVVGAVDIHDIREERLRHVSQGVN